MHQVLFSGATADVSVEQIRCSGSGTMRKHHLHGTCEIYYLMEGEVSYFIEDETYLLKKGGIAYINEDRIHRTAYVPSGAHERVLIELDARFPEKVRRLFPALPFGTFLFGDCAVFQLNPEEQKQMESLLTGLILELSSKKPGCQDGVRILLTALLLGILRKSAESGGSCFPIRNSKNGKVYQVIDYLTENYASPGSLKDLSKRFYLDKYYLCHLFKRATGLTIREYLNAVRLKKAKALLSDGKNRSITEISRDIGYESVTHFDRVFREYIGQSPLKYRKIHKDAISDSSLHN